jgi:hypothetical protein
MNRRQLLAASAALGALAQRASSLDAATTPSKAPFKVLWNDDTTNLPKWTQGEVFQDDLLRGAIDSVADKGIDAYLLSPGLGWIPWWKSQVYPDHYQWRLEKFGVKPNGASLRAVVDCGTGILPVKDWRDASLTLLKLVPFGLNPTVSASI